MGVGSIVWFICFQNFCENELSEAELDRREGKGISDLGRIYGYMWIDTKVPDLNVVKILVGEMFSRKGKQN